MCCVWRTGLHETQEKLTSVLKRKKKTIKDKNLLHRGSGFNTVVSHTFLFSLFFYSSLVLSASPACQWGLVEQAEALINDFDVDVNAADNEEGQTALHCCVTTFLRADMTSVVSLLLDKKADVNARDAEGATPLVAAFRQVGAVHFKSALSFHKASRFPRRRLCACW